MGVNGHFLTLECGDCGVTKECVFGGDCSAEALKKRADDSKMTKAVRSKSSFKDLQKTLFMLNT